MSFKQMSHFKQRLLVSLIVIAILFLAISLAINPLFKPFYILLICSIIGTAVWEYYQIAHSKGLQPYDLLGIGITVLYLITLALPETIDPSHMFPWIVLGIGLLVGFVYYFANGIDPFVNLSVTYFAIFYLTIPLGCLISITYFFPSGELQDGRAWLIYLIAVTKMTDIGGYFFGKIFGKKKLAPYISPKKTWEGSYGGLSMGVAASVIIYVTTQIFFKTPAFNITLIQSLWMGLMIAILAQLGDLAESLLKRDGGIKDSNHLPGLGGVLDMLDSLVFTAPLVYIFLKTQINP